MADVVAIIGSVIALLTLIIGIAEYIRQGKQKRAEQFIEMRRHFKENEIFRDISALLENNDPKLASEPFKNKRDYLGFFEEIALMVNSRLIKASVAHYMFGYYAIRCWESENFWKDINRNSQYWVLFRKFVEKMRKQENRFVYNDKSFRF